VLRLPVTTALPVMVCAATERSPDAVIVTPAACAAAHCRPISRARSSFSASSLRNCRRKAA